PSCRSSHQRPRFRSPSASHAHLIPPPTRRSSDLSSKATSIATENAGTSAETPGLANANSHVQIEAYWLERKKYLQELKNIPELKIRYAKALAIYLLRRLLWSFAFFPIFIAFWVPFVLSRFNLVAMVSEWLPTLQNFVQSDPQAQAATMETLVIAWFSIGFIFA